VTSLAPSIVIPPPVVLLNYVNTPSVQISGLNFLNFENQLRFDEEVLPWVCWLPIYRCSVCTL